MRTLSAVFGGVIAAVGAVPVVVFMSAPAGAAPCVDNYPVPCQNCLITASENPNFNRSSCYNGPARPGPGLNPANVCQLTRVGC